MEYAITEFEAHITKTHLHTICDFWKDNEIKLPNYKKSFAVLGDVDNEKLENICKKLNSLQEYFYFF